MDWIFTKDRPIYLQIVEQLKICIARGQIKAGDKLDSVRDLAIDAGVNPNTMQRALQELETEKILFANRTIGRFITTDEQILSELREDLSYNFISTLFENLGKMDMEKEEIITRVKTWKERK